MEKEINPTPKIEDGKSSDKKKPGGLKKLLAIAIVIIAIIYDISPIDLIPDVPVVGWIDDVVVSVLAFANLIKQMRK